MSGWIKFYRDITEWEWYKDVAVTKLFIHLLLKANHEDKIKCGRLVKRGSLETGRKELSVETGLTEQQIRTALNKLQSTSEITIQTTKHYSLITIINYSNHQSKDDATNQHSNQQNNQHSNHTIRSKEDKNNTHSKTRVRESVGLEELTVSHIAEWLTEKRGQGRYLNHDPAFVLEKFRDYCKSKNKRYTDYVAAYRNAFDWERCQPEGKTYANTGGNNGTNHGAGSHRARGNTPHDIAGRAWAAAAGINLEP